MLHLNLATQSIVNTYLSENVDRTKVGLTLFFMVFRYHVQLASENIKFKHVFRQFSHEKNDAVKEKYVKQIEGEWVHQQHIYTFTKYSVEWAKHINLKKTSILNIFVTLPV